MLNTRPATRKVRFGTALRYEARVHALRASSYISIPLLNAMLCLLSLTSH